MRSSILPSQGREARPFAAGGGAGSRIRALNVRGSGGCRDDDPERRMESTARRHQMQPAAGRQRVRRRRHRLERNEASFPRREDLRIAVACEKLHGDPPPGTADRQRRVLVGKGEALVELAISEQRIARRERFLASGRNPARIGGQPAHRGQSQSPCAPGRPGNPEIGMESEAHRHGCRDRSR